MGRAIKVIYKTDRGTKALTHEVQRGTKYQDLARAYGARLRGQVTLARAGRALHELAEEVGPDIDEVLLLDTVATEGYRTYMRSLSLVLLAAVEEVLPGYRVLVEHSISGGTYCTLREGDRIIPIDSRTRDAIRVRMEDLTAQDLPIFRQDLSLDEVRSLYRSQGREDKLAALAYREEETLAVYELGQTQDSFFGPMVPSTDYVRTFALELFNRGLVLMGPVRHRRGLVRNFMPQYKLSEAYNEAEDWAKLQGITQVTQLNQLIEEDRIGEVCRVTEVLHGHKIMKLAEEVKARGKRFIFIAAPSSSGKTSFTYKLRTGLQVLGLRPVTISLDDYYVNRVDTPLDREGKPDYESLYAIDLAYFQDDLDKLLRGEAIERIRFDFVDGVRVHTGQEIRLGGADPVLIEGIHALNPLLTGLVDQAYVYQVYLSVITQINLDDHNRIPTTDLRLMRRMARDRASRGKDLADTIVEWESVRAGEKRNIFPYQERADVVFNSSFIYEIAALKPIIEEDLRKIPPSHQAYTEARRVLGLLSHFLPLEDTSDIPPTSILREFIGGSKILE